MKAIHATIKYTRDESKSGNCEEKLPTKIKSNIYESCNRKIKSQNCEKKYPIRIFQKMKIIIKKKVSNYKHINNDNRSTYN